MDEVNPYLPPKADPDAISADPPPPGAPPAYKLYSPGHIFMASFLGVPIGGFYLLSANRRRMGHSGLATATLVVGIVVTAATAAMAVVLPRGPSYSIPMAISTALWYYAKQDEPLLDAHVGKGGQMESAWKAAGVGLASMIALLVLLVPIILLVGD
jgi:hypothetical protein